MQRVFRNFRPVVTHLFASHLNYKIFPYVNWIPDSFCSHVDAFAMYWLPHYLYYANPPFSILPSQSTTEKSLSSTGVSSVAKPDLVFELLTTNIQSLPPDQLPFFTIGPYCNPPTKETLQVMFSNCVWKHFKDQKFLESTTQLATAAFQPCAQGNHGTCFYKWDEFCTQWKIDPGAPTLTQLGDYITLMQQEFQFGHTVSCYIST